MSKREKDAEKFSKGSAVRHQDEQETMKCSADWPGYPQLEPAAPHAEPQTPPVPSKRQLVYEFMDLPTHEKWARVRKLGVWEESDKDVRGDEIDAIWAARAKAKGCVHELLTGEPAAPSVTSPTYWCCGADFGQHEATCKNSAPPVPAEPPIDYCPKCKEYLHDEMGHMCPRVPDEPRSAEHGAGPMCRTLSAEQQLEMKVSICEENKSRWIQMDTAEVRKLMTQAQSLREQLVAEQNVVAHLAQATSSLLKRAEKAEAALLTAQKDIERLRGKQRRRLN